MYKEIATEDLTRDQLIEDMWKSRVSSAVLGTMLVSGLMGILIGFAIYEGIQQTFIDKAQKLYEVEKQN